MRRHISFILFFIIALSSFSQSSQKPFILVNADSIREIKIGEQFNKDYFIQPVTEYNPKFEGLVLVSKKDYSISFALNDSRKGLKWQKPIESVFVSMSPSALRIAVAGKKQNRGFMEADVPFPNYGFTLYNENGEKIFSGLNESRILQLEFSSNDELIVLSNSEISVYDKIGKLKWNRREYYQEINLKISSDYIIATKYDSKSGKNIKALIKSDDGQLIKQWEYVPEENINPVCVLPGENKILISSLKNESNHSDWKIEFVDLKSFAVIGALNNLEGDPFCAVFNPNNNSFAFIIARPRLVTTKNAGEIILAEWSISDNKVRKISLGYPIILFSIDKTEVSLIENGYKVRLGKMEYTVKE